MFEGYYIEEQFHKNQKTLTSVKRSIQSLLKKIETFEKENANKEFSAYVDFQENGSGDKFFTLDLQSKKQTRTKQVKETTFNDSRQDYQTGE